MSYTAQPQGFLADTIQRIRTYGDEPGDDAKYTPDKLYPMIRAAYRSIARDVNRIGDDTVTCRWSVTLDANHTSFTIPTGRIHMLLRISTYDSETGRFRDAMIERGRYNIRGPGYRMEGPTIFLEPKLLGSVTVYLEFIPDGDLEIHLGTVDATNSYLSATAFPLATEADEGYVSAEDHGYVGAVWRLIGSTDVPVGYSRCPVVERVIASQTDNGTYQLITPTVDFPWSNWQTTFGSDDLTYEIVPMLGDEFREAIAWDVVSKIHAGVESRAKKYAMAVQTRNVEVRQIRLRATQMQARMGKRFHGDVPRFGMGMVASTTAI